LQRAILPDEPFLRILMTPKAPSLIQMSHDPRVTFQFSSPFEGVPASLGPGLRTASGAGRKLGAQCHRVPMSNMAEEHRDSTKAQLTLALAQGVSAARWAWYQDTVFGSHSRQWTRGSLHARTRGTSVRFWARPEIVGERRMIDEVATIEPTAEGDRANLQNKTLSVVSCPLSIAPAERSRTCDRRRRADLRAAGRRGPFGVAR
jgi:hypothetical protein